MSKLKSPKPVGPYSMFRDLSSGGWISSGQIPIDPETGNPKWQDFQFELACTELCGKSHFAMQRVVRVVTQEEYDAWVNESKSYYYTVINPDAAPLEEELIEDVIPLEEEIDSAALSIVARVR